MATYKVPQDVEADDKLLGPFTFRQFIYLMIIFGLVMVAIGLAQLVPILAVIPVPFILFFGVLALPIKKDQPMETYLMAIVSFYTKPKKRYWTPGQSESTILITAPKKTDANLTRDITGEEASHRLSFLAELVDSEGHAIKNASTNMKDEFYAEAAHAEDMFEIIDRQNAQHAAVVDSMRSAIAESEYNYENRRLEERMRIPGERVIQPRAGFVGSDSGFDAAGAPVGTSGFASGAVVQPIFSPTNESGETAQQASDRIIAENNSEVNISLR